MPPKPLGPLTLAERIEGMSKEASEAIHSSFRCKPAGLILVVSARPSDAAPANSSQAIFGGLSPVASLGQPIQSRMDDRNDPIRLSSLPS